MYEFDVPDISCGHCANVVSNAVKALDPIARVEVDIPAKRVRVESAKPREAFAASLAEAGYPPR